MRFARSVAIDGIEADQVSEVFAARTPVRAGEDSMAIPYTPGNLTGHQQGSDDVYVGINNSNNLFIGDAGMNILGSARGGDDSFTGGVNGINTFYGDAYLN